MFLRWLAEKHLLMDMSKCAAIKIILNRSFTIVQDDKD
jgi:hypothetical protein